MDDSENNSKNDESLIENKLKFKTILKDEPFISNKTTSNVNTKSISYDLNIYLKGKRLSKQLTKIKKGHSNFIKRLSIDNSIDKAKTIEKPIEPLFKSTKKTIRTNILNSNTLPNLIHDNINKEKPKKLYLSVNKDKDTQEIKDKKEEKKKNIFSSIKFRMTNLNKLYGYNKKYFKFKENLKKNKDDNLEKYQDDILRLSSLNLCRDNLLKLYTDLKNLRLNSEETKPLPPINFQTLISHSLNEKKTKKRKGFIQRNKKFKDMDEYEKEMYKIKTNSRHDKIYSNNNKFLYRMYEILPEYLVEKIYVKKKKL